MFSRLVTTADNRLASELSNVFSSLVTETDHEDGLPHTQTNTRGDTSVETLEAVSLVNVLEGLGNSQVLGSVGINSLGLHLDSNDLNRLVPSRKTTTNGGSNDLFKNVELLAIVLAGNLSNSLLTKTGKTETGAPVSALANGNSVDTLVNTSDTLLSVDILENLKGSGNLDAANSSGLVTGDLNSLHACAETHGHVGLGETTNHTTGDTSSKVSKAKVGLCSVFSLNGDEKQNSALGRSFDPGPGDKTLVKSKETTTAPDTSDGSEEGVATVGSHGGLDDLQGLTKRGDSAGLLVQFSLGGANWCKLRVVMVNILDQIQASTKQNVGEVNWLSFEFLGRHVCDDREIKNCV